MTRVLTDHCCSTIRKVIALIFKKPQLYFIVSSDLQSLAIFLDIYVYFLESFKDQIIIYAKKDFIEICEYIEYIVIEFDSRHLLETVRK